MTNYHTYSIQPAYYHSPPNALPNFPKPQPNFDRKAPKQYNPIAEPIAKLYERLKIAGYITSFLLLRSGTLPSGLSPTKYVLTI